MFGAYATFHLTKHLSTDGYYTGGKDEYLANKPWWMVAILIAIVTISFQSIKASK
jgi:hypothetical protein